VTSGFSEGGKSKEQMRGHEFHGADTKTYPATNPDKFYLQTWNASRSGGSTKDFTVGVTINTTMDNHYSTIRKDYKRVEYPIQLLDKHLLQMKETNLKEQHISSVLESRQSKSRDPTKFSFRYLSIFLACQGSR
jgi:phage terminase large subunit-like protein